MDDIGWPLIGSQDGRRLALSPLSLQKAWPDEGAQGAPIAC
jgi:hypothetical protein